MIRTRLLWFTIGFGSSSAAITQFVLRDLWIERNSLSSLLKERFNSLDTRVSNLESVVSSGPSPHQDEGNLQ